MKNLFLKNRGVALITILIILVILVMFIVAFATIITSSQNTVANYSSKITLEEVAEAGIACVLYKLNDDPSWAAYGPPYEAIDQKMDGVNGSFYITFDSSQDYCSVNNLIGSTNITRTNEPGGIVPPFVAEILIKASILDTEGNVKNSKYYSVQLVRGDFFDKSVSSEGPVVISEVSEYIDYGFLGDVSEEDGMDASSLGFGDEVSVVGDSGDDTSSVGDGGEPPSVGDPGPNPILPESEGNISGKGIIHTNYDHPESIKFNKTGDAMTVKLGTGDGVGIISTPGQIDADENIINFDDSVQQQPGSASTPSGFIDIPGIIAKRDFGPGPSPVSIQSGTYKIERDVFNDADGDFDHFEYHMEYDESEYDLSANGDWAEIDRESGDLLLKKDIYVSGNSTFEIEFNFSGRMTSDGQPSASVSPDDFPSRPVAEGDAIDPSAGESLSYSQPVLKFQSEDPSKYSTIYSECDIIFKNIELDTAAPVIGTGSIICDGSVDLRLEKNHGSLAILGSDDLKLDIAPDEELHFFGLLYSQDDIKLSSNSNLEEPPPDTHGATIQNEEISPAIGATIYSGDINPDDNNIDDPSNPASILISLQDKTVKFGKYSGYLKLLDEGSRNSYPFPVKVKSFYEL